MPALSIPWRPDINTDDDIDALLLVRISHADYLACRGHRCRITPLEPRQSLPFGARVAAVGERVVQAGFEQFTVEFTMPEAEPTQGLYRISIEGLPEHALVLVPHAASDRSLSFAATFSRKVDD